MDYLWPLSLQRKKVKQTRDKSTAWKVSLSIWKVPEIMPAAKSLPCILSSKPHEVSGGRSYFNPILQMRRLKAEADYILYQWSHR